MTNVVNLGADLIATSFTGSGSGINLNSIPRGSIAIGTASQIIVNDTNGALSSVATISTSQGGTGINSGSSTGIAKVSSGAWSFSAINDADINSAAAINRTKIANGTSNQVVINNNSGTLTSEAQLATVRGGTGIDTSSSSGIAKISSGTWIVSTIIDADISATAAISRSKIASGTSNNVIINDTNGVLSSEPQLAVSRGGLGQNFSGVGAGSYILTNSNGTFSCNTTYTPNPTVNTIMARDSGGNTSVVNLTASSVITSNITTSSGDLTLTPVGNNVSLGVKALRQTATTVTGGASGTYTANVQTTTATATSLFSYTTASGPKGTNYHAMVQISLGDNTGGSDAAIISYNIRAKNLLGTLTAGTLIQKMISNDAGLSGIDVTVTANSQSLVFNVLGIASKTLNWCGTFRIVEQQF